jgi:hypothetical protein
VTRHLCRRSWTAAAAAALLSAGLAACGGSESGSRTVRRAAGRPAPAVVPGSMHQSGAWRLVKPPVVVRLPTQQGGIVFEVYLRLSPAPGSRPDATLDYTLGGYRTGGEYESGYDLAQGSCVSREIAGTSDSYTRELFLSSPGRPVSLRVRFAHPGGTISAKAIVQDPLPGEHPDETGGDDRRLRALGC